MRVFVISYINISTHLQRDCLLFFCFKNLVVKKTPDSVVVRNSVVMGLPC